MNITTWKVTYNGHSAMSFKQMFPEQYILHYYVGRITIPKIGQIFCFRKPGNLVEFVENQMLNRFYHPFQEVIIMKGTAYNASLPRFVNNDYCREEIEYFWKLKKAHRKMLGASFARTGTVLCDKFKPTKRYTWEEFVNEAF